MTAPKGRKKASRAEPADWETIAERAIASHEEALRLLEQALQMLEAVMPTLAREKYLKVIATKLHEGLRTINRRQRDNAMQPRPATAKLREVEPSYLQKDLLAWARERGTPRGFMKSKAKALNTTPKTLLARLKRGLDAEQWQRFQQDVGEAAEKSRRNGG